MLRHDLLNTLALAAGACLAAVGFLLPRRAREGGPAQALRPAPDAGVRLRPTPPCARSATPDHSISDAYTPCSPGRRDLRQPGESAATLILTGRVLDTRCRPLPGVVLDFWQADGQGRYDAIRYRGHQHTDAEGRFQLTTVRPAPYQEGQSERPPHLHVAVQGPSTRLLTTQLYLPDEMEANRRDERFHPALLVSLCERTESVHRARFDFVLEDASY